MSDLTPITRKEMILNGENIEPITREEMILSGEDITPITRDEYFLKKAASGGGGGNPNRVQTVNGTLANPFGTMSTEEIEEVVSALPNHDDADTAWNATAFLELDGTGIGVGKGYGYLWRFGITSTVSDGLSGSSTSMQGYLGIWDFDAENSYSAEELEMYSIEGGTGTVADMLQYAEYIPTTLTIIWHPLPEES